MILLLETCPSFIDFGFVSVLFISFSFNPFTPKSDLIDFTLSNARRFYLSKEDPLGVKGLMHLTPREKKSWMVQSR